MAGKRDETLTFFVPGIMGSSLRFSGAGEHGEFVDELVWGGSFADTVDLLATHPARLGLAELKPDAVIEWLKVGFLKKPFYGPIVAFCKSEKGLGLQEGTNFFPFAYDWRADNRQTAER